MKIVIALSMIYLAVLIDPSTSIKCYSCQAISPRITHLRYHKACGDTFSKNVSLLEFCGRNFTGCQKFKIEDLSRQESVTGRACATNNTADDLSKLLSEMAKRNEFSAIGAIDIKHCNKDGCNGSQSVKYSAVVTVLIGTARFLFDRFY